jgi:hypothetical protein
MVRTVSGSVQTGLGRRGSSRGWDQDSRGSYGLFRRPLSDAVHRCRLADQVICGCQPPWSFWIRAKQYAPGRSPAGSAAKTSNPKDTTSAPSNE